ncbi:MAG: hypothetical protein E7235_04465 [Lachnospiraceae bacterium]|nr:hypothetical protein [Lachnospiraceae bacterium]
MNNLRNNILIAITGCVFAILVLMVWIMPDKEYSAAERRPLKQSPELSIESILSGRFMSNFEDYKLDQFPLRDYFRSFKAITSLKSDNNDIYVVDNVINSMEYPLNENKLTYASGRFLNIYNSYLKDSGNNIYLSIIPDKNFFYAEDNGYLSIDYDKLVSTIRNSSGYMTYIDIFPFLKGDDYYMTDTHWRQENIGDVAEALLKGMGNEQTFEYEKVDMEEDFYGVYYGQAALPLDPDSISFLTNDIIEQFKVFDHQNNKEIPVYDESKMTSDDPYELFTGGPISLATIENPSCDNGKHLIIFRDSFGSSLAPLLAQGYSKTTLIDIRYIMPQMLGSLVDFENADVLFVYSTSVLNNSETLK